MPCSTSTAAWHSCKSGKRKGSAAKLALKLSAIAKKKPCGDGITFLKRALLCANKDVRHMIVMLNPESNCGPVATPLSRKISPVRGAK
jgi:hypothetical protein